MMSVMCMIRALIFVRAATFGQLTKHIFDHGGGSGLVSKKSLPAWHSTFRPLTKTGRESYSSPLAHAEAVFEFASWPEDKSVAFRTSFPIAVSLAVYLDLFGCISIQKSEPTIINTDLAKASSFIQQWAARTFNQKATFFKDAVASEYVPSE